MKKKFFFHFENFFFIQRLSTTEIIKDALTSGKISLALSFLQNKKWEKYFQKIYPKFSKKFFRERKNYLSGMKSLKESSDEKSFDTLSEMKNVALKLFYQSLTQNQVGKKKK